MTPQLLVQKIKAVLAIAPAFDDTYARTLADAYAQLTHETNMRLDQCRDLIERQMFSEALAVSETVPSLPDLSAHLGFDGLDAWVELCAFFHWPMPETVPADKDALRLLKDAYASNRILEPLQKLFRTSVRVGMTRETLQIIGRLEKIDHNNPNWRLNRAEFEKKRLGEIREEFEACRQSPEEPVLRTMLGEISAMTCCSDDALASQLATICDRLERERLNAAAEHLISELGAAYSAMNVQVGRKVLTRYTEIINTGKVKESGVMRLQHAEAAAWLAEEDRKEKAEQDYQEAVAVLRALIETQANDGVEKAAATMESFGREDDDRELTGQARTWMAILQKKRNMRRAAKVAVMAGSSLLLCAGVCLMLWRHGRERKVLEHVNDLRLAFEAEDVTRFSERLAEIEQKEPRLFHDPRILTEAACLPELRTKTEEREARFQKLMRMFSEAISTGGARQRASCEEALNGLRIQAVTPSQKKRVESAENNWRDFLSRQREEDNTALKTLNQSLSDGLSETSELVSQRDFNGARSKLDALDRMIAERAKLHYTDTTEQLSRFASFSNATANAWVNLQDRYVAFGMIEKATTLENYLYAIEKYVGSFPEDRVSTDLKRVLRNSTSYQRFDRSIPGHIWTGHLRGSESVTNLVGAINDILTLPGCSGLWRLKARNIANAMDMEFYFPHEPHPVIGAEQLKPGRVKLYQEVYYKEMGRFQHKFEKRVLNLEIEGLPTQVTGCSPLTNLLTHLKTDLTDLNLSNRSMIIETFKKTATDKSLPAQVRLWLIDRFLRDLNATMAPFTTDAGKIAASRKGVVIPVPESFIDVIQAVSSRPEAVAGENNLMETFAVRISLTPQERVEDSLLVTANTRAVRFVGFAGKDGQPDLQSIFRGGVEEIWVADISSRTPSPLVVYERHGETWAAVAGAAPFASYTPFFAPTDGKTTRFYRDKIRASFQGEFRFPEMWPRNMK